MSAIPQAKSLYKHGSLMQFQPGYFGAYQKRRDPVTQEWFLRRITQPPVGVVTFNERLQDIPPEQLEAVPVNGLFAARRSPVEGGEFSPGNSVLYVYVGGDNASDDYADDPEWGMVEEKPFASLGTASDYVRNNKFATVVWFVIQGDITEPHAVSQDFYDIPWIIYNPNGYTITVPQLSFSGRAGIFSGKYRLTGGAGITCGIQVACSGFLFLENVTASNAGVYLLGSNFCGTMFVFGGEFSTSGANSAIFYAQHMSHIILDGTPKVSGSGLATIVCGANSALCYRTVDSSLSGTFTGKKYHLATNSYVFTRSQTGTIPGTLAGTLGTGCAVS